MEGCDWSMDGGRQPIRRLRSQKGGGAKPSWRERSSLCFIFLKKTDFLFCPSYPEGPTKLEREILYKIHIFYWTKIFGFANISVHPNERGLREILFSFS